MVRVIGYGSLLCEKSANNTCDIKNFSHWYIQWYSRIFNKLGFNPYLEEYNDDTAMLNVFPNENNWLLISYFDVDKSEYHKMQKRECDYDECEVQIYDLEKNPVGTGILYVSKEFVDYHWEKKKMLFDNITPEKRYLDICLNAVKKTDFYDEFLDSTYMSCKKMKLREYVEKELII